MAASFVAIFLFYSFPFISNLILASFPSDFGPQNCTDPNEEFHECIGICPGSSNWRDSNCAQILKQENEGHQQPLQLPTGLGRPLCWSLRCFPGCRCRNGFVREFVDAGEINHRPKCVEAKDCKGQMEYENGTIRVERNDEILPILLGNEANETTNLNETRNEV